jgi:nucleotide-binding universal stress UspA family protein
MTIIVGYIPTAEGRVALELAIREATLRGSAIEIVNVAVHDNFADITFADELDLDAVTARLTEAGIEHRINQITDATNIAVAILDVAAQLEAELIVVGLRRRSPVEMALLGSNAQRIILSATCPVLSIRPQID